MRGFVPTPEATVDLMVRRLFARRPPSAESRLLDAGCGHGAFIHGVLRWCANRSTPPPRITGVELDPEKLTVARESLRGTGSVRLIQKDFLACRLKSFDYIIANPPYVAIDRLAESERLTYRERFKTANGRLDLYLLFWERALGLLKPSGRLAFVTPEKFTYVETARPLRKLLGDYQINELLFLSEDTFPGLTTYPVVTTVDARPPSRETRVTSRSGATLRVRLPQSGDSWQSVIRRAPDLKGTRTLADVALRVSCGVATGADRVYVVSEGDVEKRLWSRSYPTVAGRDLRAQREVVSSGRRILVPYDRHGRLLPEHRLGALRTYLNQPSNRSRLEARTCVRRKAWYAFHDSLPLPEILRPKILCKDIAREPRFWIDRSGELLPLHSVYYIVPRDPTVLDDLATFLRSPEVGEWLEGHCQRAANDFLRIQSSVLKRLPIPDDLGVAKVKVACSASA